MMNLTGIYNPEVHKQGDTQSTVSKTAAKRGFCSVHNDVQIYFIIGGNKPCYRCEEEHQIELNRKKAENELAIRELEIRKNTLELNIENSDLSSREPILSIEKIDNSDILSNYVSKQYFDENNSIMNVEFENIKTKIQELKDNQSNIIDKEEVKESFIFLNEEIESFKIQLSQLNKINFYEELSSLKNEIVCLKNKNNNSLEKVNQFEQFEQLNEKINLLENENILLREQINQLKILSNPIENDKNILLESINKKIRLIEFIVERLDRLYPLELVEYEVEIEEREKNSKGLRKNLLKKKNSNDKPIETSSSDFKKIFENENFGKIIIFSNDSDFTKSQIQQIIKHGWIVYRHKYANCHYTIFKGYLIKYFNDYFPNGIISKNANTSFRFDENPNFILNTFSKIANQNICHGTNIFNTTYVSFEKNKFDDDNNLPGLLFFELNILTEIHFVVNNIFKLYLTYIKIKEPGFEIPEDFN